MGLAQSLGTVEIGKQADMVLLDADPLADIRNTRKIHTVISRGALYDPAPLWKAVDFQP
jgi:imidazolonepropionase-like amidohydrolase